MLATMAGKQISCSAPKMTLVVPYLRTINVDDLGSLKG